MLFFFNLEVSLITSITKAGWAAEREIEHKQKESGRRHQPEVVVSQNTEGVSVVSSFTLALMERASGVPLILH